MSQAQTTEKTASFLLNNPVLNADGTITKDGSKETRSQEELQKLSQVDVIKGWPPLTKGQVLLGLINSKSNCENLEEMAKLQRLLVKIRNKSLTERGEWKANKEELLDVKAVFDKTPMDQLNINLHGQIYNEIQDLILKVTN